LGQLNTAARPWPRLSAEARSFITNLIQPRSSSRMTPGKAWNHPWISRWRDSYSDNMGLQCVSSGIAEVDRTSRWTILDGLQRLCWLALARAVTEPELVEVPSLQHFIRNQNGLGIAMSYIEQLAIEMACCATPAWFSPGAVWNDVMRLAFRYLDGDNDGVLSIGDVAQHLVGEDVDNFAKLWISKWSYHQEAQLVHTTCGLRFDDFGRILSSSCIVDGRPDLCIRAVPPCDMAKAIALPSHLKPGAADYGISFDEQGELPFVSSIRKAKQDEVTKKSELEEKQMDSDQQVSRHSNPGDSDALGYGL